MTRTPLQLPGVPLSSVYAASWVNAEDGDNGSAEGRVQELHSSLEEQEEAAPLMIHSANLSG